MEVKLNTLSTEVIIQTDMYKEGKPFYVSLLSHINADGSGYPSLYLSLPIDTAKDLHEKLGKALAEQLASLNPRK